MSAGWLVASLAAVPAAALAGAGLHGLFHPRSRLFGPVVSRLPDRGTRAGPRREGIVALTFDDGPWPGSTDRVLDVLRDRGVRACFFVIGENVRRWPALVERAHAEGHVVANHSLDHHRWGAFGRGRYWASQVAGCSAEIERVIALRPALFRPPMGLKTPHTMRAARDEGLRVVTWSRRARDGVATTVGSMRRRIERSAPGDIVLLHDGVEPGRSRKPAPTAEALPAIIDRLGRAGLGIERLDRALGVEPYLDPRACDASHAAGARPISEA